MPATNYMHFIIPGLMELKTAGQSYQDIVIHFIKEQIRHQVLRPGDQLPPHRVFANYNNIHPNTASRIYQCMRDMGITETNSRSRTSIARSKATMEAQGSHFATSSTPTAPDLPQTARALGYLPELQNYYGIGIDRPRLSNLLKANMGKYVRYMVHKEIGKYQAILLKELHDHTALPRLLSEHLRLGQQLILNEGELTVIRGRNKSLIQVFKTLMTFDSVVLNTQPQDNIAAEALQACCGRVLNLCAAEPNFIAELEALLSHTKIDLLYIKAQCSFPEGATLSDADGKQLVELAKQHHFYLVDEQEDHEFWQEKLPYAMLAKLPHEGHLILLQALSKLSTELEYYRIICASDKIIHALKRDDAHSERTLAELAMAEMIRNGTLRQLQHQAGASARKQAQKLVQMLKQELGGYVSFESPRCGLSLWIAFPEDLDLAEILIRLENRNAQVQVPYHPALQYVQSPARYMRLGYGHLNLREGLLPAQLIPGIIRKLRGSSF